MFHPVFLILLLFEIIYVVSSTFREMPEYKLTYFNFEGLGEPIRFLLSYTVKDFHENGISHDKWPDFKEKKPVGKVSLLEIDGKIFYQSLEVLRIMAPQAGLAGSTAEEELEIAMIVATYGDFVQEISRYKLMQNPTEKEKRRETIINERIPFYVSKFETILNKNGGYLANGKLSWAELYVVGHSSSLPTVIGYDVNENYPFWKELTDRVYALPGIEHWIIKTPETIL